MKNMELNEEKILKKFEKYKGYSAVLFDHEEWRESEAYEVGYTQALKDNKVGEMLEMLINVKEYLNDDDKWSVEQLIKQTSES